MVLPNGEIANLGTRSKKNSTGYCLDQLVIGSEGTLGIITKATLKLLPLAPYIRRTYWRYLPTRKRLSAWYPFY